MCGEPTATWITQRPGLRPRTVDLYRWLLKKHIAPYIGSVAVGKMSAATVREWRAKLLANGVSVSMAAKASCGHDRSGTPPGPKQSGHCGRWPGTAGPTTHNGRFRALVLLATFASLRWGEVSALTRADLDQKARTVRIRAAYVERSTGPLVLGPPKSQAGRRIVGIPAAIVPDLERHLAVYVKPDPGALVFPGIMGGPIRRGNFNKLSGWPHAVEAIGMPGLHVHDLRHTGDQFAANSGAGCATSWRGWVTTPSGPR